MNNQHQRVDITHAINVMDTFEYRIFQILMSKLAGKANEEMNTYLSIQEIVQCKGYSLFRAKSMINPLSNETMGYHVQLLSWYVPDTVRVEFIPYTWYGQIFKHHTSNYLFSTLHFMAYLRGQYVNMNNQYRSMGIPESAHDYTLIAKREVIGKYMMMSSERWRDKHLETTQTTVKEIGWINSYRTEGDYDIYVLNPDNIANETFNTRA